MRSQRRILAACLVLLAPAAQAADITARLTFCASCHGAQGVPPDNDVPVIWGQQADYLAKQLRDYRSGDRDNQIMSSVAESLSDDEITALTEWFSRQNWPATASGGQHPALPAETMTVCQTCHQPSYLGGAVANIGTAPRLAGQRAAYLAATMAAYANDERTNSTVMPPMMAPLSSANRAAIAAALGGLGQN
jgi:cytochrome c553